MILTTGLELITEFAMVLDNQAYEELYEGKPKEVMTSCPPMRDLSFPSRFEEFGASNTKGPVTIGFYYSPNGDAGEILRRQIGHRN